MMIRRGQKREDQMNVKMTRRVREGEGLEEEGEELWRDCCGGEEDRVMSGAWHKDCQGN